jgi:hypothetical protein
MSCLPFSFALGDYEDRHDTNSDKVEKVLHIKKAVPLLYNKKGGTAINSIRNRTLSNIVKIYNTIIPLFSQ